MRPQLSLFLLSGLCAGAAAQSEDDPWTPVLWQWQQGNFVQGVPSVEIPGLSLNTGHCLDVLNHVVVVHDSNNARVGCGVITAPAASAGEDSGGDSSPSVFVATATIGQYPGAANSPVSGSVTVVANADNSGILFEAFLEDVSGTGMVENATGGVHIHTGTSCASADEVGGHFFLIPYTAPERSAGPDVWANVEYYTDGAGCVNPQIDNLEVTGLYYDADASEDDPPAITDATGADMNVAGHAVVLHDTDGAIAGCGVINSDPWTEVVYTTDGEGNSAETIVVDGFSIEEEETENEHDDGPFVNVRGTFTTALRCSTAMLPVTRPCFRHKNQAGKLSHSVLLYALQVAWLLRMTAMVNASCVAAVLAMVSWLICSPTQTLLCPW